MSERTEDPTPRRLAQARDRGEAPVSGAATQAATLAVATLLVPATLAATADEVGAMLRAAMRPGDAPAWDAASVAWATARLALPLLAAVAAAAALAAGAQARGLFAPGKLAPDASRLDPFAGLAGLVSRQRAWTAARSLIAGAVVLIIAARALGDAVADLARAAGRTAAAVAIAGAVASRVGRGTLAVALVIGAVDLLVVRRAFWSKLKMTRAEVQREHRESEGDPQLKAARERAHHEMLAAATVNAVRDATVVIVNPTHLATALRWNEGEDDAPVVVAQGEGELARRIREAAVAYGVPVVHDVPVARALAELAVGDAIPEALYEAVAEILREAWAAGEPGAEG